MEKRRDFNQRSRHMRWAHCAACNHIDRYVVYASGKHRLRKQRCRVCRTELGRRANVRALEIRNAEKAALKAKALLQRQQFGGRSTGGPALAADIARSLLTR